jgi:hypothetical protein
VWAVGECLFCGGTGEPLPQFAPVGNSRGNSRNDDASRRVRRPGPSAAAEGGARRREAKKVGICRDFRAGRCKRGDACRFLHSGGAGGRPTKRGARAGGGGSAQGGGTGLADEGVVIAGGRNSLGVGPARGQGAVDATAHSKEQLMEIAIKQKVGARARGPTLARSIDRYGLIIARSAGRGCINSS